MNEPVLAVVLATLGRPEAVRRLLPRIREQAPTRSEIVVVDQSEPEVLRHTRRFVEGQGDPRITFLARDQPSLPLARNAGLAATTAEVVLFLDDDVTLGAGCFAAHLSRYRDPTVGGVVGRIFERRLVANAWRTTNRVGWDGRIRTRLDGPDPVEVETLKGANMSFRRLALEQAVPLGPFDDGYGGNALLEDADVSTHVRRCGWRLVYEPDATVLHDHAAEGGVRHATSDPRRLEAWRFHNTGRYVATHRPALAAAAVGATFAMLAVRHAIRWRSPAAVPSLMSSLVRGWMRTDVQGP
ncbi:MAG: glycosyltransferase [Myxococcales bacterium]|nr:glycosyltransferase [Myxococcales bacterium]